MQSDADGLSFELADGVALITFNRPERRNAVTTAMQQAYLRMLLEADRDPDVRAIVITGAGSAFCAGADFSRLDALTSDPDARAAVSAEELPRYLPLTLSCPVIVAVNGPAVGLGFVYAAFGDIRFAGESGSFSLPFARLGLIAEYGLSWLLPRLVGPGNAFDLLYSGRLIDSHEAARIGLVQRVVPDAELVEAATSYARELAERCSPRSLATIRRQVYGDLDRAFMPAFEESMSLMLEALAHPDAAEGIAAFRARRAPRFAP